MILGPGRINSLDNVSDEVGGPSEESQEGPTASDMEVDIDHAEAAESLRQLAIRNTHFSAEVRSMLRKRRLSTRTLSESQPANLAEPKRYVMYCRKRNNAL